MNWPYANIAPNKKSIMKPYIFIIIFSILTSAFLPARRCFSDEVLNPTEIIKQSDDLMRGESNSGTYTMLIRTPHWQRELKLFVHSLGRDKIFIRILSPAKEAGIGTLRVAHEMWNYLPNVEKTIKIPPSLMLQPWMGSDFANDDLVKESSIVHDYNHTIVQEINVNGDIVLVIELLPKPESAVIWGKIVRHVRQKDFVPLQEEYYDEKGKLIKILEYSDIGQVSYRIIPRVWIMTSRIKPGSSTTIKLLDVQYNIPMEDDTFTLTNLKKIQ